MPKINYQYEKRQKDLAKKKKQEEKRLKRLNRSAAKADGTPEGSGDAEGTPTPEAEGDA